jgi:2-(1,2-epoxy-1,2-dihydrophenyl)acetyl-CoA isomerase
MTDAPVLLEIREGIAHVRLNRPEASNGMNVPLLEGLLAVIRAVRDDPSARVVLMTGEGPNFCAGGDVKEFASHGEELPAYIRDATALLQDAAEALIGLDSPVIAAVHGYAAGGGGLGLVCAADFVIAADTARFMSGATRVGMAPDAGVSLTLTRLVGLRRALDIVLRSPQLTASDALEIGLITRVVPEAELTAAAGALAEELAAMAPLALAASKRLIWNGLTSDIRPQLDEEARTVTELSGTADSREGLAAVIQKRPPRFEGR